MHCHALRVQDIVDVAREIDTIMNNSEVDDNAIKCDCTAFHPSVLYESVCNSDCRDKTFFQQFCMHQC